MREIDGLGFRSCCRLHRSRRGCRQPDIRADSEIPSPPLRALGQSAFFVDLQLPNDTTDQVLLVTTPARSEKVYCPTDVRINGESYPTAITGELTISWSHRNRLGSWSYADSGKTTSPEAGTEYDILVYGELDTLVHTESGLTGTTWTYLEALEIVESGLERLNDNLRVVIRTYGAGRTHAAIQEVEWELDRG